MSFDLDQFLPYRLAVAAAQVSRRFARRYAAEAGLTIPEWRVLAHLDGCGPVSVREITARVNWAFDLDAAAGLVAAYFQKALSSCRKRSGK